jgi:hypothetical protein
MRSDTDKVNTSLALHDPESNDLKTARQLADEVINVSGALVKVYLRTENADYDQVWDEDPDPSYWTPITIKAFFKPNAIEAELERWGIDVKNKVELTFSHRQLYELVGERMLRNGDVIQIPFNSIPITLKNYRVVNATPAGNFRYNWLYFMCQTELLTADITVRPNDDTPMPVDEPLPEGAMYRESL